jgi:hypothetical protein
MAQEYVTAAACAALSVFVAVSSMSQVAYTLYQHEQQCAPCTPPDTRCRSTRPLLPRHFPWCTSTPTVHPAQADPAAAISRGLPLGPDNPLQQLLQCTACTTVDRSTIGFLHRRSRKFNCSS